jgi:hypothetical protein
MAKALGYGKIELDIKLEKLKYSKEEYLKAYEEEMSIFIDEWIDTPQIKELFAMANNEIVSDKSLEYQKLENPTTRDREKNDFIRAKKNRGYLQRYSKIGNVTISSLNSFVDKEEVELERKVREEELKRLELLEKEQKAKELLIEQEKAKKRAEEKKWQDKWEAVQRVDKKYKKKALEDYLRNYSNSPKADDAKKELENMGGSTVKSVPKGLDFSNADDSKSIERAMKPVQNPTDDDKDKLEEVIKRVYPSLKVKKKKQFGKSKLMVRWLGDDRFKSSISG